MNPVFRVSTKGLKAVLRCAVGYREEMQTKYADKRLPCMPLCC